MVGKNLNTLTFMASPSWSWLQSLSWSARSLSYRWVNWIPATKSSIPTGGLSIGSPAAAAAESGALVGDLTWAHTTHQHSNGTSKKKSRAS